MTETLNGIAACPLGERWALVTGGTDGIGKEVALGLARRGIHVVIVGRDPDKGECTASALRELTGNSHVEFVAADLTLVREAHRVAEEIAARTPALHYLVHSAGIVRGRWVLSDEGIESNFAVNYLTRFVLTNRLLPLLEAAGQPGAAARIVVIGGGARGGTVYFDDVNLTHNFRTLRAVFQFQRANDLFTCELPRRVAKRASITISCMKYGPVKTNIRREFPAWMKWLVALVFDPLLAQTPEQAAEPALRLLLDDEYEGVTGGLFTKVVKFKQIIPDERELDETLNRRFWALSEYLATQALEASESPDRAPHAAGASPAGTGQRLLS